VLEDVASGVSYRADTGGYALPGVSEFEFEDVPVSDYRLTLFSEDRVRYAAPTRFVRPSADDIEFVATAEIDALRIRVLDGPSGHELDPTKVSEGWNAWGLSRGRWVDLRFLEASEVERWVVAARDRRPASGGTLESAHVEARLEPGWSCALFFTEVAKDSGRVRKGPLAGVEVRADGVPVARSDGTGLALGSLARRPGRIECALPGWADAHGGDLTYDAEELIAGDVYLRRE
jgi:hypothetical protein